MVKIFYGGAHFRIYDEDIELPDVRLTKEIEIDGLWRL